MNRREAIQRVAMILGGSVIGANLFLEGCTRSASSSVEGLFEKKNIDFLNELAEAILPKTSTPGAKEANVGAFIPVMIRDCYTETDQQAFVAGLDEINVLTKKQFNKTFLEMTAEERFAFVKILDVDAKEFQKSRNEKLDKIKEQYKKEAGPEADNFTIDQKMAKVKDETANHFFAMLKQLTLTGFFTSEVGMTQALRYVKIPGRYDGEFPYKKGDRAFA